MEEKEWALQSKCRNLTPQEADALFFPGPGGKVNKADAYCNGCPVLAQCLTEAITRNLHGFFAGTTQDIRSGMVKFNDHVVLGLELPPEPVKKRKVYLKVVPSEDPFAWLDTVRPDDSIITMMDNLDKYGVPTDAIWDEVIA